MFVNCGGGERARGKGGDGRNNVATACSTHSQNSFPSQFASRNLILIMYASFRITRLVRGLSSAAAFAPTNMDAAREIASKNKEVVQVVGTVVASVGIVGGAVIYATGWKGEAKEIKEKVAGLEKLVATKVEVAEVEKSLAKVETDVKTFVKKEELAKVETEVKNLATKEAVAKVETEVKNVLQSARLEGENAALRAWKEKEASVAGGKASLGAGNQS